MAARKKASEDGHDAIVRRLLASQSGAFVPAPKAAPAISPADLLSAARRVGTELLPGLTTFSGSALEWMVRQVRSGTWEDAMAFALASPLTIERGGVPRLAALVACDGPFLTALMASLFGTVAERRPDPTASELSVFAQLVVRLRDGLDGELDHAPPEPPADCMRLFAPEDPAPLVVEFDVAFAETSGLLTLFMDRRTGARFLPADAPARAATSMNRLPLKGRVCLPGPRMRLAAVGELVVGDTLAVTGRPHLAVAGRDVATGTLGRDGDLRTLSLVPQPHNQEARDG